TNLFLSSVDSPPGFLNNFLGSITSTPVLCGVVHQCRTVREIEVEFAGGRIHRALMLVSWGRSDMSCPEERMLPVFDNRYQMRSVVVNLGPRARHVLRPRVSRLQKI
ncbi:hypothetical protein, partial [Pseudomonas syringae]|uniref:hypothetical protein n=1 Tax=Pseudomonas syringae TaxID=317 RepID=UPI002FDA4B08